MIRIFLQVCAVGGWLIGTLGCSIIGFGGAIGLMEPNMHGNSAWLLLEIPAFISMCAGIAWGLRAAL